MRRRAHILVCGLVQGVFFRAFVQEKARHLGLLGWVKNLENDKVEIMAEGEKEKIDNLIKRVKQGPRGAKVDKLDISWGKYRDEFTSFKIEQ